MMMPKPTRLTKIVRKMIRSGRVTSVPTFYTITHHDHIAEHALRRAQGVPSSSRDGLRIADWRCRHGCGGDVVGAAAEIRTARADARRVERRDDAAAHPRHARHRRRPASL